MKKKNPPAKPEEKKNAGNLLQSYQNISMEASPPILLANIPMNLNSEMKINLKGKIKLNELLDDLKKEISGGNKNLVDISFLAKKSLDVFQVESKLDPASDLCASYTTIGFDIREERLFPVKAFKTNSEYRIKIMQVTDSQNNNYVLKRCWISFKISSLTLFEFNKITMFLVDKYTEYAANKLYYACRYSAKIAGYHIIHLKNNATNQMMLVTEMLSVFAGNPLSSVFPVKDSSTILDYFIQILHAGSFLEAYKIEHNDIKPNNFLIEFLGAFGLIKLIDFDVGAIQPQDLATNKSLGCKGFSDGYVAPEMLLIIKSVLNPELQKRMLSELNPWKCHSYSMGILMLEMIGFIPDEMQFEKFDTLKKTEADHNQIINKLNEYYNKQTDKILKNIIHLIILCLLYKPEQRASVKEILSLIEQIDKKDLDSIQAEYKELCDQRKPSRSTLIARIEELNKQINPLQMQIYYLNEERNSLIQFLNKRFPDANINFNENLFAKALEIINSLCNSLEIKQNAKENENTQLRNDLEKSMIENTVLLNTNAFLKDNLDLRMKELIETQKSSALKDAQIQMLNQKSQENEHMIKIQRNKINETETENMKLKKESDDLKLKIKEYEANEKLLKDQGVQYQKQLHEKENGIEEVTKKMNQIKEEFNTEKNKPNKNIKNSQKDIAEQKEVINKLIEEINQKEHSYRTIESQFQNFFSNIIKIIQEKGFKLVIQNMAIEVILSTLQKLLPAAKHEEKDSSIDDQCKICGKVQNYQEMKTCIISSPKLSKEVLQIIKEKDKLWLLCDSKFKINEMIILRPLISISIQLEYIDLGYNSDFNLKCFEMLIESIKLNKSLKELHYIEIMMTLK